MRVLITNDDGYQSCGLAAIRDSLGEHHTVWTLAPDGDRSGMSHSITSEGPIRLRRIAERSYTTSGTPADCVILALNGIIGDGFDIVVSGVNIGANLGTDIIYSGTAAAARQAVIMGIPGIALSLHRPEPPRYFDHITRFVCEHLDRLHSLGNSSHFVNINSPNQKQKFRAVEITVPTRRIYHERTRRHDAGEGDEYWSINGCPIDSEARPGSDLYAINRGLLSISPIHIDPLQGETEGEYRRLFANT